MAHTEKDLELEGHTLPTQELIAEAKRLVDLARTHAIDVRAHGIELKHLTELDQVREMLAKEHARVEARPPKLVPLTREQDKLVARAYQWRAALVRRADRAWADDRHLRLRYHRAFELHRLPERLYEELHLLLAQARLDVRKLAPAGADEAFLNRGEDILYELQGLGVPDRKAWQDYLDRGRRVPPGQTPPEEPAKLPAVTDSAKALSILKGRLYLAMRELSAAGQVAFCLNVADLDKDRHEPVRREFLLRVKPTEDDDELFTLGRPRDAAAPAQAPSRPGIPAARPAAAPPPPPEPVPPPPAPPPLTSKPGGPTPPPPADPFKKPPPRAVGLVRPSATHGTK